jgi:hypothetical protein
VRAASRARVGGPQLRTARLAAQHGELMAEHQQLHVFGERVAPAARKQTEQGREGEISERTAASAEPLQSPTPPLN